MKRGKRHGINFYAVLMLALWVQGCAYVPEMSVFGQKPQEQKYKPLNVPAAVMAVPPSVAGPGQLYCRVGKGEARFKDGWHHFADAAFILSRNRRVNVSLTPRKDNGKTAGFQSYFDFEGQKLVFCPLVDGPPGQRVVCASIYALDDDLKMGIKRTFDIPDAVAGGSITCAYQQVNLKKL